MPVRRKVKGSGKSQTGGKVFKLDCLSFFVTDGPGEGRAASML